MYCPICKHTNTSVSDSRMTENGQAIRRRRECMMCHSRFTTFERVLLREMVVVKRNGKKRPFDREKMVRSITMACRKRDIDEARIEEESTRIMSHLYGLGKQEISTREIGELILSMLARLDTVAYVRFASVYKDFKSKQDFQSFLKSIGSRNAE